MSLRSGSDSVRSISLAPLCSPLILVGEGGLLLFALFTGFNYGGVLVLYAATVAGTWGYRHVGQVYGWLYHRRVRAIDAMAKNAPAGSESAVAAFKNALTTSQTALETAQAQAKKVVEAAQANFNTAATQAADAIKKATTV